MVITVPEWKLTPERWKLAMLDWNSSTLNDFWVWKKWTKYIFSHFKLPVPILSLARDEISTNYMEFYRKHGITISMEELNNLREKFLNPRLSEIHLQKGALFLIKECKRLGMKVAIISAEKASIFQRQMEQFQLNKIVDKTIGGVRNKQDVFVEYLEEFNVQPEKAFYIGDTSSDVKDANAVGITSIAFTGGLNTEKKLLEENPDFICHSFVEALSAAA